MHATLLPVLAGLSVAAACVLAALVVARAVAGRSDDLRAATEDPAAVLARRAAQLRTRPLLASPNLIEDAHKLRDSLTAAERARVVSRLQSGPGELRVVPVLQNGQLARPIIVRDWR